MGHRTLLLLGLAAAGRLGVGIFPVAAIFFFAGRGQLPLAGLSAGLFGASAALAGPLRARLLELLQSTSLTVFAAIGFGVTVWVLSSAALASRVALIGLLSCLAGVLVPPFSVLVQRHIGQTLAPDRRKAAFSLDVGLSSTANFLAPLVAAGLISVSPTLTIPVSAVTVSLSTTGLILIDPSRRWVRAEAKERTNLFYVYVRTNRSQFARIACATALVGCTIGTLEVLLAGVAKAAGSLNSGAWLLAAMLSASAVTGIWCSIRPTRLISREYLTQLLAVFGGLVLCLCLTLRNGVVAAPVIVVIGAVEGIITIILFIEADRLSTAHDKGLAMAWIGSSNNLGASVGAVSAAWLFGRGGALPVLIVGVAALVGAVLTTTITREAGNQRGSLPVSRHE